MKRRYLVLGLGAVLAISLAVPAAGGPSNPVATTAQSAAQAMKVAKRAVRLARRANRRAGAAQSSANAARSAANAANANANTRLRNVVTRVLPHEVPADGPSIHTTPCNAGERAVGGGFGLPNGFGTSDDFIMGSAPNPGANSSTPTGWSVRAWNASGAGTFDLDVYAVCASP